MCIYDWIFMERTLHQTVSTELRCGICRPLALNANVNIQTMQWKWFRLQLNILKSQHLSGASGASCGKTDVPGKIVASRITGQLGSSFPLVCQRSEQTWKCNSVVSPANQHTPRVPLHVSDLSNTGRGLRGTRAPAVKDKCTRFVAVEFRLRRALRRRRRAAPLALYFPTVLVKVSRCALTCPRPRDVLRRSRTFWPSASSTCDTRRCRPRRTGRRRRRLVCSRCGRACPCPAFCYAWGCWGFCRSLSRPPRRGRCSSGRSVPLSFGNPAPNPSRWGAPPSAGSLGSAPTAAPSLSPSPLGLLCLPGCPLARDPSSCLRVPLNRLPCLSLPSVSAPSAPWSPLWAQTTSWVYRWWPRWSPSRLRTALDTDPCCHLKDKARYTLNYNQCDSDQQQLDLLFPTWGRSSSLEEPRASFSTDNRGDELPVVTQHIHKRPESQAATRSPLDADKNARILTFGVDICTQVHKYWGTRRAEMVIYWFVSGGGMQTDGPDRLVWICRCPARTFPRWLLGDESEAEGQRALSGLLSQLSSVDCASPAAPLGCFSLVLI